MQNNRLKIVSGGQTGVDRAALETAIEIGLPHGGWCPRGRLAEDGPIDSQFELRETEQAAYRFRTERNILDSDGTLVLHRKPIQGGTALTIQLANKHQRPLCVINLNQRLIPNFVDDWLSCHSIQTLNVAGPRESTDPGIGQATREFLLAMLLPISETSSD